MSTGHANHPKDRSPSIRNQLCGVSRRLAYGTDHRAVIGAAGTFTEMVQRFLNWNEPSKGRCIENHLQCSVRARWRVAH